MASLHQNLAYVARFQLWIPFWWVLHRAATQRPNGSDIQGSCLYIFCRAYFDTQFYIDSLIFFHLTPFTPKFSSPSPNHSHTFQLPHHNASQNLGGMGVQNMHTLFRSGRVSHPLFFPPPVVSPMANGCSTNVPLQLWGRG